MITVRVKSIEPFVRVEGYPDTPYTGDIKTVLPDVRILVARLTDDEAWVVDLPVVEITFENVSKLTEEDFINLIASMRSQIIQALIIAQRTYTDLYQLLVTDERMTG